MAEYFLNLAVAFDILVMAIFGGKRNETLSSAAWSLEQDGKFWGKVFRPVIDWLFTPVQKNHCYTQWLFENKAQVWNGNDN